MIQETKTKILNIVRWVLFLPASAIGSYIIYWLVTFMWSEKHPYFGIDDIWNFIISLVGQLVMGGAFVLIGTNVAPKGEKIVSIILFALICVLDGVAITGNLSRGFSWSNLIGELCTLIGAGIALYLVVKEKI